MKHRFTALSAAAVLAASMSAWGQTATQPSGAPSNTTRSPQTNYRGPVVWVNTNVVVGTITDIQRERRTLTARTDSGRIIKMAVGPEVHNFGQLKQGDLVTIRYTEAEAFALSKNPGQGQASGIRSTVEASAATQAPQGAQRPSIGATERTTIVANVFDIDKQRGILTLRGTSGDTVDIRTNPKALEQIDKNDQVVISYMQATAVDIRPGNTRPTGPMPGQAGSGTSGAS